MGRYIILLHLDKNIRERNEKIPTVSLIMVKNSIGGLNQPFYWRKTTAMMWGYAVFYQCLLMLAGAIAIILAPPICWPVFIKGLHNQITTVFGDD